METVIATRVDKALHDKIAQRRRDLKLLTGIEPSVSAVVRVMVQEAATAYDARRKKKRRTG